MFGSEFRAGVVPLAILAAANLVNAATGMSGAVLDMTGYTRWKLLNATVSVALGIALNLLLVPSLGMVGAAIAVLAVTAGTNILPLAEVLLLVRASPYNRSFVKPLGAGAVALVASIGMRMLLGGAGELFQVAAGLLVLLITYGLVLFGLGIDDDDRLVLGSVRARFARRGRGNNRGQTPARSSKEPL
jgi:O-antigen/teichoic acid export membrane protein